MAFSRKGVVVSVRERTTWFVNAPAVKGVTVRMRLFLASLD
jgi:hypothetical protein